MCVWLGSTVCRTSRSTFEAPPSDSWRCLFFLLRPSRARRSGVSASLTSCILVLLLRCQVQRGLAMLWHRWPPGTGGRRDNNLSLAPVIHFGYRSRMAASQARRKRTNPPILRVHGQPNYRYRTPEPCEFQECNGSDLHTFPRWCLLCYDTG